jgi:hypothetical protein
MKGRRSGQSVGTGATGLVGAPFFEWTDFHGGRRGPVFFRGHTPNGSTQLNDDFSVSGLLSYSAAYHFDAGPLLRMTWHRVATAYDYNRDSDIILIGVGYGF